MHVSDRSERLVQNANENRTTAAAKRIEIVIYAL